MTDAADTIDPAQVARIITDAKKLAVEYRQVTGRPLGITAEVAEFEAARLLNLRLAPVRQDGYDALRDDGTRIQVKGRCIQENGKSDRVSTIKLNKEWDAVVLVLLDRDLDPIEIHEAQRLEISAALLKPGSKARNERGALSVSQFRAIGQLVWARKGRA